MNIDPNLVQLLTGNTLGQRQQAQENIPNWFQQIIQAHRQAQQTKPGYDQFNGIIDPGDIPNSKVIDPDPIMSYMGTQQSSEQPDYKPDPTEMLGASDEKIMNILRLLRNYNTWSQGQEH